MQMLRNNFLINLRPFFLMLYSLFHVSGCWFGLSFVFVHYKVNFLIALLATYIFIFPIILFKNEKAVLILGNICSFLWTSILLALFFTNDQVSVINWFKTYSITDSTLFIFWVCLLWFTASSVFLFVFSKISIFHSANSNEFKKTKYK